MLIVTFWGPGLLRAPRPRQSRAPWSEPAVLHCACYRFCGPSGVGRLLGRARGRDGHEAHDVRHEVGWSARGDGKQSRLVVRQRRDQTFHR
eukprot:3920662-Pyramimonas_sp.AAC.1